jgi:hypothetical protein
MPVSSSDRAKRSIRAAKPWKRARRSTSDDKLVDQEMLRRHGLLEPRPKGAPRSLDEQTDRFFARELAKIR